MYLAKKNSRYEHLFSEILDHFGIWDIIAKHVSLLYLNTMVVFLVIFLFPSRRSAGGRAILVCARL